MNIIGLLRVKNEARWIERVLASMKPLCSPILMLDDHSMDGTPELCEKAGAIVIRSQYTGIDEARDKDLLVAKAAEYKPDWCVMLDGDEILAPGGAELIRASIASGAANSYSVKFLYLWDREDQYRVDGIYARTRRQSIWKFGPNQRFMRTKFGGNFHCGSVPQQFLHSARPCNAAILHLGYLHKEDRLRKMEWYNRIDPNNTFEDCYRHMVIGDLSPAETKTKWAGPLKLEALKCEATAT